MTDKNAGIEKVKTFAQQYPEVIPGGDDVEKIKLELDTTEGQDTENIDIFKKIMNDPTVISQLEKQKN